MHEASEFSTYTDSGDNKAKFTITSGQGTQTKEFGAQSSATIPALTIFGLNDNGSMNAAHYCVSGARLEYFRITDGAANERTVRRDFVPCCRDIDGVVGFYDISGQSQNPFYTSANSATFIAGPDMARFRIAAIPTQYFDGTHACEPEATVIDKVTGNTLDPNDFTIAYSGNAARGTATVTVTANAGTAYAGDKSVQTFRVALVCRVTDFALAEEGDGRSWDSPMSLTNAIAAAQDNDLLLLKAGRYVAAKQIVIAKPLVIRGGLKGTDDTTLDPDEPMTYFDARDNSAFQSMVSVTTAAGEGNEFERICFTRGYARGLVKTGAADITFKNCRFYQNGGLFNPNGGFSGVGANLTGTSAVEARFEDCVFDYNARTNYPGNRNTCMQGAGFYATGFKRVYVDNCLFATNCGIMGISGEYGQDRGDGGGAIYVSGQPLTVRNTRFIANNTPGRNDRGGTVRIIGASGGTAFSNCTFVANCTKWSSGYTSLGAPISISSANTTDFYDIEGCTFAYNVTAGSTSSAGLTVDKGTAKVRNSIFYGNKAVGISAHYGREISVYSNGKLDIDYSLLTGSDDSYISSSAAANLTLGDHMVYGDPLFGTTLAEANALKSGDYYNVKKYAELMAIDVHENALGEGYSRAVDTGTGDFTNEPAPNGGVRNLGVYGNTTEAAVSSALGTPALTADGIAVEFAADTKPTVTVTPGGGVNYNAHVLIEIADTDPDGGSFEGWTERAVFSAVQTGEPVAFGGSGLHQPGVTLHVLVTVEYPGMAAPLVVAKTATVTGDLPFYYGHGGGEGVIHVREGAAGKKDGSDWTDAFDSIDAALALAAADATKTNIWVAGTIVTDIAPGSRSPAAAELTIRGGFRGDEDSLADRASGTYATLNGKAGAYDMVSLNNAHPVIIERIVFERAAAHGLYKKGSGTLDLVDCKFHLNSLPSSSSTGRGLCLEGGTRVSVTNCVFLGNYMSGGGSSSSKGGGIYATGVGRLYLDDSLFVTNGCNPACGIQGSMSGRDQCGGGLLLLSGVPVTARNCRFTANRTPIRGSGGAIWIGGAGSAFTNCVFTGNQSTYAEGDLTKNGGSESGGAIVVSLGSAAGTVDFEHCTLAYNLGDALHVPGGLNVIKGTVRMHNSIIFSNTRGKLSDVGSDISVLANGRLTLSYCRLTEEDGDTGRPTARTVTEASEGLITYDHVTFGDPGFATSLEDYEKLLKYSGDYTYFDYSAAGIRNTTLLDVHLCSPAGMMTNDGEWHTRETRLSNAIDKGDPDSPFANEPQPNGDQANLGAYGNTKGASCCAKAQPEIVGVEVTYPNGFARPLVTVTMGGNGTYFADVTISFGRGNVEQEGYAYNFDFSGVLNGAVLTAFARHCIAPGGEFSWKVTAGAEDAQIRERTGTAIVPDALTVPDYDGTGGDPAKVVHVWPEAVGGNRDGVSWWDGYASVEDALAHVTAERNEIWLTHGTNQLPTSVTLKKDFPVVIRAGFRPTDCSPADRDLANASVVNPGCGANTLLTVSSTQGITLDGFVMTGAVTRAISKSGAGDLTLLNGRFFGNGIKAANANGRGLYVDGSSKAASVVVSNCVFGGNIFSPGSDSRKQGAGCGIYATSCRRLTLDDTLFVTNGLAGGVLDEGIGGWAFYANATPVTARRCRFLGNKGGCRNYGSSMMGGVVRLDGACGGSAFTNCIWSGNWEFAGNGSSGSYGGALTLALSSVSDTVELKNCTVAYNFANCNQSPGGVNVVKGTLKLLDSIVACNMIGSYGVGAGVAKDIDVKADGRVEIGYALITDTTSYYLGGDRANIKFDYEIVKTGDPSFVTPMAVGQARRTDTGLSGTWADWVTNDVHLLSLAGNWRNDGTFMTGEVHSVAIDNGNPNDRRLIEPFYNGDRLNLGAYGNTEEASLTPHGQPKIGAIEVTYPHGYTRPEVAVTMDSAQPGEVYSATVTVVCRQGDEEIGKKTFDGVANGAELRWVVPYFFDAGAEMTIDVSFEAAAADSGSKSQTETIGGTKPDWANRGGGATVVHIWDGATNGLFLGTSWADAFTNLNQAAAANAITLDKTAIWFAGERSRMTSALPTITIRSPMLIAGGFTGYENTPAERPAGTITTVDGQNAYNTMVIDNRAETTFERLVFTRAGSHGFSKSGSGDVTFVDCQFLGNTAPNGDTEGRGTSLTGSGSTVAFSNCVFRGNVKTGGGSSQARGSAIYATGMKRIVCDNCLFVTNGCSPTGGIAGSTPGRDWTDGDGVWLNGVPGTFRNCEFLGNRGAVRGGGGGVILLSGAAGGSAFTNCVFAGSQCNYAEGSGMSGSTGRGGVLCIDLSSTASTVDLEHCTIAYNFADAWNQPAGLFVVKGTVRLHNSIVFGNRVGTFNREGHYGADIGVTANGRLDVSWTKLTDTNDTYYVTEASEGLITWGEGVTTGDPGLVTDYVSFTNRIKTSTNPANYTYLDNSAAGAAFLGSINCHLRGGAYFDEASGAMVRNWARVRWQSAAIDAGDPDSPYGREPDLPYVGSNGKRANLGAYGNTPEATMTPLRGAFLRFR